MQEAIDKSFKVVTLWGVFLMLCSLQAVAVPLTGTVVKITDGDTIHVLDHEKKIHKVRLGGIDAPEKKQSFGNKSKHRLAALLATKEVSIEWTKRDRWGRIIGKVFSEGMNVNAEMVASGMAWVSRKYDHELSDSDIRLYYAMEYQAVQEGLGLWGDSNPPISPWDFRKAQRNKGKR